MTVTHALYLYRNEESDSKTLIGYYTSLKEACQARKDIKRTGKYRIIKDSFIIKSI